MMAAIENGVLERLRAAGTPEVLGYGFRTLESYPEDFDSYLAEKVRGRAFPGVWVVFGGWGRPEDVGQEVRVPATFMVVVAAENLRNETAQRHGAGPDEVGSYQLVTDVAALLHGQTLGLPIDRLELGPCRSIRPTQAIAERKVSMYALEFTTGWGLAAVPFGPADEPADFSTFSADWDAPPFGGVDADPDSPGIQLPAPDRADASDAMELPA
jgi:phage gp37-like protein